MQRERGQAAQGTVEYSVLLALVVIGAILAISLLGGAVQGVFSNIICQISQQPCFGVQGQAPVVPSTVNTRFLYSSVDSMKLSRDTDTNQLSQAEVNSAVAAMAQIGSNYITVDGYWSYPDYAQKWVDAIRAQGKHVWFRMQPAQWEDNAGTTGIMAPSTFLTGEQAFILGHPSLFASGDVYDAISEPENGLYWAATYGDCVTCNAPNSYTQAYNQFILDSTNTANAAFATLGISGIVTGIRSTNGYYASHPEALYNSTVAALGFVTYDSYPEGSDTNPADDAALRLNDLQWVVDAHPTTPIVLGEIGYSNYAIVSDSQQEAVIKAELDALRPHNEIAGANYWVGPGGSGAGGYTNILVGAGGSWSERPAAADLAAFYAYEASKP